MKKIFWISMMLVFALAACEKEEIIEDDNNIINVNYLPLAVGNYWVYDCYSIDKVSGKKFLFGNDSIIVRRDTIVNGKTYYALTRWSMTETYPYLETLLRDSSGYIVNLSGKTLLSFTNFTDTLSRYDRLDHSSAIKVDSLYWTVPTIYTLTYKMEDAESINVPLGTFEAVNCKGTFIVTDQYNIQNLPNPRYMDTYYADGVGKILEQAAYIESLTILERRLVSYSVKPY